jgi:hypothetical protein
MHLTVTWRDANNFNRSEAIGFECLAKTGSLFYHTKQSAYCFEGDVLQAVGWSGPSETMVEW